MNLWHYYHWYVDGDWNPAMQHFAELDRSGLRAALNGELGIGLVGSDVNIARAEAWIDQQYGDSECIIVAVANNGWEQVTLNELRIDANIYQVPHTLVLYAHSKGAAYGSSHQDVWRHNMQAGCVTDWQRVVEEMSTGQYDCAGCYYTKELFYADGVPVLAGVRGLSSVVDLLERESDGWKYREETNEPEPVNERYHFSGNYWWSTTEWLRRLPVCPVATRHDAEMWIGRAADGSYPRALDLRTGSPFDRVAP